MRSIPSSLKSKIEKTNQTIYENAEPKMKVLVGRATTDPFYVETIREKTGLGDIGVTLLRLDPNEAPTHAYEIHNDNGTIKTTIRSLTDFSPNRWKHQFDVGTGKACSIEFDGYWDIDANKKYNLITEDKPYIFWTDDTDVLWCQKWDDVNTRVQLDINVLRISTIRGWKDIQGEIVDQGLICAYIKSDGKAYHRVYCTQSDLSVTWETPIELTQFPSPISQLGLFRTNDYRVGFLAESQYDGNIYLSVTTRSYSGMAIEPDVIYGADLYELSIELTEITESEYDSENSIVNAADVKDINISLFDPSFSGSVSFISGSKVSNNSFNMKFNYPLDRVTDDLKNSFTVTSSTALTITSITISSSDTLLITVAESLGYMPLTVTYTGGNSLKGIVSSCAWLDVPLFSVVIQMDLPIPSEYVSADLFEVSLSIKDVYYTDLNQDIGIVTGADLYQVSIVLTKVNDNPI